MANCCTCYGDVIKTTKSCPTPNLCLCAPHIFVKSVDSVVECGVEAFTPFPADSIESTLCGEDALEYFIESVENATDVSINQTGITYTSVPGTGRKLFKIVYSIRCGKYGTYGSLSGYYKDECVNLFIQSDQICDPCTGNITTIETDLEVSPNQGLDLEVTPNEV